MSEVPGPPALALNSFAKTRSLLLPSLLALDVATWLYTALHGLTLVGS